MSSPLLSSSGGVIRLAVHVQPGAKRNAVVGMHGDALKLAVSAPPVDGKANEAITDFVAQCFGLTRRAVSVASGHTSRRKTLTLHDISMADASSRLEQLLAQVLEQRGDATA